MWFVACEQVLDDFPRGCQIRFCMILQKKIVGKDEPRTDIFPREFWASGTCIIYLYSCTRYLQPTPTRKSYWFQQDGAFIHTTVAARSWLQGQVRRPSHQSPHCAPLACQKPWPLSVGLMVLWRLHGGSTQNNTSIPKRPKDNGGARVDSVQEQEVSRAVRHLCWRARACHPSRGTLRDTAGQTEELVQWQWVNTVSHQQWAYMFAIQLWCVQKMRWIIAHSFSRKIKQNKIWHPEGKSSKTCLHATNHLKNG